MYACICHAVTTAEVDAAVALGATSVKQVRQATGAGSACGTCVKRLSCLLAAARVADSAPTEAMPEAERLPEGELIGAAAPAAEGVPAGEATPAAAGALAAEDSLVAGGAPASAPATPAQAGALPVRHAPHCPAAVPALG